MKKIESNLKKQKILIIVLAILLIILGCYIIISEIQQSEKEKQIQFYNIGLQEGYEQAVIQIFQYASTCQELPISYDNQTINLIAVECLQSEESSKH